MKFSILRTKVLLTLVMMLCSVVFIGTIHAQSGTSTLNGTITDQAGAAVPGASVRLVNPITGFNRTVTTNEQGVYSFPSIPPATYQIEVV
ncbi:MAG TPA: carboxypeptidase-like regulatory domain-containing protein, partial [Pyrinomonadaceae bacterium]